MKNTKTAIKNQTNAYVTSLCATAVLTVAGWGFASVSSAQDASSSQKIQLMFVQTAEDFKADTAKKTLRLVNVTPQTLYFSDRPQRIAGNLTMPAYMDEWKAGAGPDNFANDPPNATLSVYEGGNKENTLAVVEISNPVIEGKDLIYKYKLIEGEMPKNGGATALFIDWIGAGGGVGPGFHGVGAGTRGVGLTGGYGGPAR
ncbi:hypothetical protein [Crocosphaera sp. XPORK-15E]|uniref:hypothetical protein n=1 Tax=Crocosphaera sp. XPORK-15E TaxID=3110247 RepID=UPI002B1F7DC1|nr:hypothetical protein [Crocosphaera sp. XPORK-15E]MEA5532566.1 hypothetical protein [Crocosphaera sp. XPORK-15E]